MVNLISNPLRIRLKLSTILLLEQMLLPRSRRKTETLTPKKLRMLRKISKQLIRTITKSKIALKVNAMSQR